MYPNGYYTPIDTSECLKNTCEFINALIQIEDKNYFSHWGINLPSKLRAIKDNLSEKRISGWSTITEQYVKNKYFKTAKRSYLQKAREAVLALYFTIWSPSSRGMSEGQGEFFSNKQKILNLYYHDAYFWNRLYGVWAALEVYFQKNKLEDLSQEEITILLSLLHNPGIESLEEDYFREYFEQVKERLGYEFDRTYFGKLPKKENIDRFPFVTQRWLSWNMTPPPANAGIPLIEGEQKEASLGGGRCPKDGGSCDWVSIDSTLQSYARDVLQQTLKELADKNVTNGAIFAINPKTRETLIYQGSKDFYAKDIDGQVNVIESLRQPGSTMKPFLYLQALEQGANPDDLLLDIESEYNSFEKGSVYISENYSLKEYGLVRFKKALGNSFNNASVRLARELGLEKVYDFYKYYGFILPQNAEHYGYSLVLGNPSISLKQLVESYARLLDLKNPSKFLLYDMLSDPDNRDVSFGVNSILNTSISQAVKTGTSSDFRDNLVLSYHPDFVLWVWVGNNDNSSMQGITGITGAGYIWHQVIEKAIELGYIKNTHIPLPEWVYESNYCLDRDCFRKENIFVSEVNKKYHSAIAQWVYDEQDIFEDLSEYELNRLNELSIEIQ